ncbi:hypothetical protein DM860_003959 [Cuscuta australis]|uniref:Transmembrane protein n=1 Tax=Cuscuta australis TaxID=267555 RepID=A0A328CUW7_9ASTE|nr:hypothetical protein DM860_003959 [Cuscuta australis]
MPHSFSVPHFSSYLLALTSLLLPFLFFSHLTPFSHFFNSSVFSIYLFFFLIFFQQVGLKGSYGRSTTSHSTTRIVGFTSARRAEEYLTPVFFALVVSFVSALSFSAVRVWGTRTDFRLVLTANQRLKEEFEKFLEQENVRRAPRKNCGRFRHLLETFLLVVLPREDAPPAAPTKVVETDARKRVKERVTSFDEKQKNCIPW